MIKFGIISFAHMHADGYARAVKQLASCGEQVQLTAIADEQQERLRQKAAEFSVSVQAPDYNELLRGDAVDAVIVCSENSKHAKHVVAALRGGKHVLCEKPIGVSEADLQAMREAVTTDGAPWFQTAFVCRFAPAVMEAKRRLDKGELGAIKAISATNHGSYPGGWFGEQLLAGGGAIMDHTVHAADVIRLLTRDEFATVRAFKGKNIRAELAVEDNALIYARLERTGVPVSIDCSWSRHATWPTWGDLTVNIFCERGVLKVDAFRPHIQVADAARFTYEGLGEDTSLKLVRSFVQAIRQRQGQSEAPERGAERPASALDRQLRAGFEDGAAAVKVALAAYLSSAGSNQPVAAV